MPVCVCVSICVFTIVKTGVVQDTLDSLPHRAQIQTHLLNCSIYTEAERQRHVTLIYNQIKENVSDICVAGKVYTQGDGARGQWTDTWAGDVMSTGRLSISKFQLQGSGLR